MRLGVEAALVGGQLVLGDVEIHDGRIAALGRAGKGQGIACPGLVDLQVNGFAGVDFLAADADAYARAGEALLASGVTAYLPTLISAPEEALLEALRHVPRGPSAPRILGVHLEGPFLNPARLGAHPEQARRDPDPALLERLLQAGPVRLVTLAPELPGAHELIRRLRRQGVAVSAGHTEASAEEAHAAFDLGVRSVTHLFNAMRPFRPRDPGIAGAALARADVTVQVIADPAHLADDTLRLVWRAAAGRMALVSDAVAAAGIGDGSFALGGQAVEARDGVVRRPDGTLAGTTLTLLEAARRAHALGMPLPEALDAASRVPARLVAAEPLGSLAIGGPADLLVLDDRLEVRRVLVGGKPRAEA
jgi:N-acetylglucosamine-6-phosphate deacetylase